MSKATYWERGDSLDYPNTGDTVIEANTILAIGAKIGVAGTDINPGETGSIHVTGVFQMEKADTSAISMGTTVYWNGTAITATETGAAVGYAAADSADGTATVLVKLLG